MRLLPRYNHQASNDKTQIREGQDFPKCNSRRTMHNIFLAKLQKKKRQLFISNQTSQTINKITI